MREDIVGVHGSYFHENFGDILLVAKYRQWVTEAAPGATTVLPMASERARELIGAHARGLHKLSKAKALVYTGGGYFGETPGQELMWRLKSWARHGPPAIVAKRNQIPYAIVGVGAGPITNLGIRKWMVNLCNGAEVLAVRDEESARHLREYGVDSGKILVTADAALTMRWENVPASSVERVDARLATFAGRTLIGVHLDLAASVAQHQDMLARELANLQQSHPDAELICFFDAKYIRRRSTDAGPFFAAIQNAAPRPPHFIPYENPWDLAALIGRLDIIFTTKLHVGIVATALDRDVVAIPAHPKTIRFYRQTGQSERCLPRESVKARALEHLMSSIVAGKLPRHDGPVNTARDAAGRNRELVRSFVKSTVAP